MTAQPLIKVTLDSLQNLLNKTKEDEVTISETKEILFNSINNLCLLNEISTPGGFAKYYFEILPEATTKKLAFNTVNKMHKELLGFFKYNTYKEFKTALMD
jgi:predicted ATPase